MPRALSWSPLGERLARALLAAPLLALSGCAVAGPRLLSSPAEYDVYRTARVAKEPLPRLRAERAYLAAYPRGAFHAEVEQAHEREEQAFYDRRKSYKEGLEEYLAVLPEGPHAMDATLRIADIKERSGEAATDRLVLKGKGIEERLRLAAENRKAALEAVSDWLSDLASVKSSGKFVNDFPKLSPAFDARYRERPRPKCDRDRCLRLESWPYQVPVAGGGLDELELTLQVTVRRTGDDVAAVVIHGPAMFTRAWEASQGVPLPKDQVGARAFAVGYVSDLVGGTFAGTLPPTCEVPAAPPIVWRRSCQGLELTLVAGDAPSDDDSITLAPAPR